MMNVKLGVEEISLRQVQKTAEEAFKSGFFCCEAVMDAIRQNFKINVPKEVIGMASGMAVGAGHSGCMCGALNGGILALGMIFGRTEPLGPKDPTVQQCLSYTHELHDWFKTINKKNAVCCRILTKEFDMGKGEHKNQCIYFTGLCAWKVADIIAREFRIAITDEEHLPTPCCSVVGGA